MPGGHRDLRVVLLKCLELFHDPYIVDLERVILRASQQPVSVDRVPPHLSNRLVVRLHAVHVLPASRVPNFHIVVLGTGHNKGGRRVPIARLDIGAVASVGEFLLGCEEVEDAGCRVV